MIFIWKWERTESASVSCSVVSDFVTPRTAACQAPLSVEFSRLWRRLEWVAIPFSRDLCDPGIKCRSPALQADSLPSEPPGKWKGERGKGWLPRSWLEHTGVYQGTCATDRENGWEERLCTWIWICRLRFPWKLVRQSKIWIWEALRSLDHRQVLGNTAWEDNLKPWTWMKYFNLTSKKINDKTVKSINI